MSGLAERFAHISLPLVIVFIIAVLVVVVITIGMILARQERQEEEIRRIIARGKDYGDDQNNVPPTPRNA